MRFLQALKLDNNTECTNNRTFGRNPGFGGRFSVRPGGWPRPVIKNALLLIRTGLWLNRSAYTYFCLYDTR